MNKFRIPIYFIFFLSGTTIIWYFGHHRPEQNILQTEPKKVYNTKPPLKSKNSIMTKRTTETIERSQTDEKSIVSPTYQDDNTVDSLSESTEIKDPTALSNKDIRSTSKQTEIIKKDSQTQEEAAAAQSEVKALMAEIDARLELNQSYISESKNKIKQEAHGIVDHLNSLPLEEQQNLLLWVKVKFYTDVLLENPDRNKAVLDKVWDDFLELFVGAGYTLPDGVE